MRALVDMFVVCLNMLTRPQAGWPGNVGLLIGLAGLAKLLEHIGLAWAPCAGEACCQGQLKRLLGLVGRFGWVGRQLLSWLRQRS